MKLGHFVWGLLAVAGVAMAQAPAAEDSSVGTMAQERARIAQERAREEARYAAEEAACYQRFAVNDCLRAVHVRQRTTFEELRRQEIILNDAERKQRGAEQIQRQEEKTSPQAQQEEAERRRAAQQDYQERLESTRQKQAERARTDAQREVRTPRQPASAGAAIDDASRAQERRKFDDKQREAQEGRARRDKALADKAGQVAHPLPTPP